RLKNRRFIKAKKNIESKHPYLILKEYNGSNKICSFTDIDYGDFEDIYNTVFNLGSSLRIKPTSKFDVIKNKFPYLELLELGEGNSLSKFLDKEYGEFYGKFFKVLNQNKRHPERSRKNKLHASQRDDVKNKRKNTCEK